MSLLCLAAPADALDFKLGAQARGGRNSLAGDLPGEGDWTGRSGGGGSLIAELFFRPDVALGIEPGFTRRRSRQQFKERGVVVDWWDYEFDYVTVPVVVRVTGDPGGVRGFVTAGLEVAFLVDATAHEEGVTNDITDDLNSTTLGALFGAGAMVPAWGHSLSFELRYVQGLQSILDGGEAVPGSGLSSPSVKYAGVELLVGFLFALGGE